MCCVVTGKALGLALLQPLLSTWETGAVHLAWLGSLVMAKLSGIVQMWAHKDVEKWAKEVKRRFCLTSEGQKYLI